MPVIRLDPRRLLRLIDVKNLELSKLVEILFALKCECEVSENEIAIEVPSDRPDMFSAEGIARAVRLFLGVEEPRKLAIDRIGIEVEVEPPRKRPYIAVALVEGVELDERGLEELIEFQEKLHVTYGRNRRKVAIGLHDADKLPSTKLIYKAVNIDEYTMVPLHVGRREKIRWVLENTEQGRVYGLLALEGNLHPAIFAGSEIIAIPPVLNSDITRLEPTSKRVFVDVTGTDLESVLKVLNVIVNTLTFYGGRVVGAVIKYPWGTITTPNLEWRRMELDLRYASRMLGIELKPCEVAKLLKRMGYIVNAGDDRVVVEVPPHRVDILHPIDLVEDVAIAIGYDYLGREYLASYGRSEEDPLVLVERLLRELAVGLGYLEVNTFALMPSRILRELSNDFLAIENPLTVEFDSIRNMLVASLLMVLRDSQHASMPIKIFEVGDVVVRDDRSPTKWRNKTMFAMLLADSVLKFEDIHGDVYALLKELGIEPSFRRCTKRIAIEGRTACIYVDNEEIGWVGEIKPEILENLDIRYPVAVAELDVDKLVRMLWA